ncbi:MAG: hypothetical protein ACI9BD_000124 [Candidatus Marinamargulisbacteria bacterium]|jgi:hypothetical protein
MSAIALLRIVKILLLGIATISGILLVYAFSSFMSENIGMALLEFLPVLAWVMAPYLGLWFLIKHVQQSGFLFFGVVFSTVFICIASFFVYLRMTFFERVDGGIGFLKLPAIIWLLIVMMWCLHQGVLKIRTSSE